MRAPIALTDLCQGFTEYKRAEDRILERLYASYPDGKVYRTEFQPVSSNFLGTWSECTEVPHDAEFIGNYRKPV